MMEKLNDYLKEKSNTNKINNPNHTRGKSLNNFNSIDTINPLREPMNNRFNENYKKCKKILSF